MTELTVTEADLCALVLAAGRGDRMGADRPKQYLEVGDTDDPSRTVLDLLLTSYQDTSEVGEICLVFGEDDFARAEAIANQYPKVKNLVPGGRTRHESVLRGVAAIQTKITLIHDAARPLLYAPALKDCLEKLQNGARIVHTATHPYASMLLTTDGGPVKGVIERNEIAYGMCPAAFYTEDLRDAFRMAAERGLSYRDEAAMMHALRPDIVMETVPGHRSGFKLTYAEDMEMLTVYRRHLDS